MSSAPRKRSKKRKKKEKQQKHRQSRENSFHKHFPAVSYRAPSKSSQASSNACSDVEERRFEPFGKAVHAVTWKSGASAPRKGWK
jgi:hypothetical protein